ncbi:hypothetical protein N7475_003100 [Penicillium sp. IBT 31633x]|nr:hypothetical protein N7475_003100 [Penicillium sp. IBT 31633x]
MADQAPHLEWCTFCETEGHDIVHCHDLFLFLTNFERQISQPVDWMASQFTEPKRVARWGQAKRTNGSNKTSNEVDMMQTAGRDPAMPSASSGVPTGSTWYPTILDTNLNPTEAEMLAAYSAQHQTFWLWYNQMSI